MKDDLVQKLKMYRGVRDVLRKPENLALWEDNPEYLTELVDLFEGKAGELGAFGEAQSQGTSGVTQQQNLAETTLEDAAHPLSRALRMALRAESNLSDAALWDLQLTDWRRMHETALLEKARALHAALLPRTQGENPSGTKFGITAAKVTPLSDLIDDYDEVIGAPRAARSERKAKTADLRPRLRQIDGILDDIDDLIIALRGQSAAHDLFVATYFNARRIGSHSTNTTTNSTNPPSTSATP